MKSKMVERKFTKIFFRVFPTEKMTWDYVKILDDRKTIYIRCLQELAKSREKVNPTFWTFQTDQIFYNNSQSEIYNSIATDVLDNLSQGHDAIVTAYGQTGTGKSLTISGLHTTFEDRGILPRIIPDLFQMKKAATAQNNIKMCIQISFIEISRSSLFDLLKPYPNMIHSLKEISKIKVKTEDEAFELIFKSEGRKEYAENCSYPSHSNSSICTFYISTKNCKMQNHQLSQCKLHVIDLAGADTVGNISCFFKNPQDIGSGNLAKTQLEQFFLVLNADIPEYIKIKHRLNPMIQYLGTSLSNSSILRFIGHIRVTREDLLITISMLRFGGLIGGLKASRYEINIDSNDVSPQRIHKLEEELRKIKMENQYSSNLMHQDKSKFLNEERFAHIQRTVNEYLQNKITELTLLNVCEVNIAFDILKSLYKKCEEEKLKDVSQPKMKRMSSANAKLRPKTSRSSNFQSTESATKRPEEKPSLEKSRSGSATMKGSSKEKIAPRDSLHETSSKIRSRTSSSSLLRRSLTGRKRSQSSTNSSQKLKTLKSNMVLVLDNLPPEYAEAWAVYLNEKTEDYGNFVELYQKNESSAKAAYQTYLAELKNLRDINAHIDKVKSDLFMFKMTRNLQISHNNSESEFEQCCLQQLKKAEDEQQQKQEVVLNAQAELKLHVDLCKQVKKDLKEHFDQFCIEKYEMVPFHENKQDTLMNIEETLEEENMERTENNEVPLTQDPEFARFERLKILIENEKKKRKLYQIKHRNWIMYQ